MDLYQIITLSREQLGRGTSVRVQALEDTERLYGEMASSMLRIVESNRALGRGTCLIIPVGPVGQYACLLEEIRNTGASLADVSFIQMDEYLDAGGNWITADHPLSFRGYLARRFFGRMPESARFSPENWIVPDPKRQEYVVEAISERGGVDAAFAGLGLNGHLAFNEPEDVGIQEYASRSTRVVEIAAESRAHMAVNLSCPLDVIPSRAITIGMREILGSRSIYVYANRPWQRGIIRLALHGPVTPKCPASYVQLHEDVTVTLTAHVAEPVALELC